MRHQIKSISGALLFDCDAPDTRHALEQAVAVNADLRGAALRYSDLYGADLRYADLRYSDLCRADLRRANLRYSDLCRADLRRANLRRANLREAKLRRANLYMADLYGADLRGASLCGADLRGADLYGADLYGADLRYAKNAPLIITGLEWIVIIDGIGNMRIGCQRHSIEEWSGFDDQIIQKMASSALEFWYRHKPMLLAMCERYKHKSDGGDA